MQLWKQRLFARLHKPAEDGGDLGGAPAVEDKTEPAAPAAEEPQEEDRAAAMLEALSADPAPKAETKPEPAAPAADTAQPEVKTEGAPPAAGQEQPKPDVDADEAAALEGVRSERGRERIKAVFAERKEIKAERDQLNADISEFRKLVTDTGMDAGEFAQSLQYGKLSKSQDPKDLESALEMVEAQRSQLYQRLGREAPGVDLLSKHEDLRTAVDGMEISRERAVELATFRARAAQQQAQVQAQQQSAAEQQRVQQGFEQARVQMEQYLSSRSKEVDHPARWKVISEHFQKPGAMQQFVQNNPEPAQMVGALRWMYDNIQVARQATPTHQPISARTTALGRPSIAGQTSEDRTMALIDSMSL